MGVSHTDIRFGTLLPPTPVPTPTSKPPTCPTNLPVYPCSLYHPLAHYASKLALTTPLHVLCALAFAATSYGLAGLRAQAAALAWHLTLAVLLLLISGQVGKGLLAWIL